MAISLTHYDFDLTPWQVVTLSFHGAQFQSSRFELMWNIRNHLKAS